MTDDLTRELLRLAWLMAGGAGEPAGKDRKRLMRRLRRLRARGAPPVGGTAATAAGYKRALRTIDQLFSNAAAARQGRLNHLKGVPPGQLLGRLRRPWRGAAGRAAIRARGTASGARRARQETSRALRADGASVAEIARRLGVTVRTVRRDLGT